MNFILKAFTTGYCQMTFVDSSVVLVTLLIPVLIYVVVGIWKEYKK